jgi:hypothetical protein
LALRKILDNAVIERIGLGLKRGLAFLGPLLRAVGLGARMVRISLRRPFTARQPRRWWVLTLGLVLIPLLHLGFATRSDRLQTTHSAYTLSAATGLREQESLIYFLYYKNLYPLATTLPRPGQSRADAEQILKSHGNTLVMEVGVPTSSQLRNGDHLRIHLYLLDALWKNSTEKVSVRPASILGFVLALMGLYLSFWWIGRPFLGAGAVALLSSHPAQLYEVYVRDNIFGWTVTSAIVTLALCLPIMDGRGPRRWPTSRRWTDLGIPGGLLALAVAAGLFLGTVRHIRTEAALIVVSALGVCLLAAGLHWKRRLILTGAVLASYLGASALWTAYFRHKIARTHALVQASGGFPHPDALSPVMHHYVWFPIWCGLGDYGQDRGFYWLDNRAHAYVKRVLKEKYNLEYPTWYEHAWVLPGQFLDEKRRYPKLPYSVPHYFEIIRDNVLGEIRADPLWYLGVLAKRGKAILTEMPEVKVALGPQYRLWLPSPWFLYPALLLLMLVTRNRFSWQLLCFTLPLSVPALLIYSKGGMIYTSTYYLFGVLVGLNVIMQVPAWWVRRLRGHQAARRRQVVGGVQYTSDAPAQS